MVEDLYVSYRVTEDCNAGAACKARCFSQEEELFQAPPFSEITLGLAQLRRAGVTRLNVMGGEPTLREDLPQIVRYAHDLGFSVVLSTNAIALTKERLDQLAPYLDWISLSIDADTRDVNDKLRGRGQWQGAMNVARWHKEGNCPFRLKVNTQVTALNHNKIDGIPDALDGNIRVWKLLQWTPRAGAIHVMETYSVDSEVYLATVARMRNRYPGLDIVERLYPEPDPDTAIVRPGGNLELNSELFDYKVVGNILSEDPSAVLTRAAQIYPRFEPENKTEFTHSYPPVS